MKGRCGERRLLHVHDHLCAAPRQSPRAVAPSLATGYSASGPMLRVGVDVGGTHTDAALLQGDEVLKSLKVTTTVPCDAGVAESIRQVLAASGASPPAVAAVMIGTTHFINALLQRRGLAKVLAMGH
jgi:activator of 2-hydroxyglutaryl-CoA dehydratase